MRKKKRLASPLNYRDSTSRRLATLAPNLHQADAKLANAQLQLLTKFDGLRVAGVVQSNCVLITSANLAARHSYMSWKTSKFASGLVSLFMDFTPDVQVEGRVEQVREAMLALLTGLSDSQTLDSLTRRVRWAPNAQALWYLRVDVMTLLSTHRSEAQARHCLHEITQMFLGLVHASQMSRPTRLNQN